MTIYSLDELLFLEPVCCLPPMKNGLSLTVDVWLSFVEMQHSVIFKIFIYQLCWVFVVVHRLSFPMAYGILVLPPGMEPQSPCIGRRFLNQWTTRGVLAFSILITGTVSPMSTSGCQPWVVIIWSWTFLSLWKVHSGFRTSSGAPQATLLSSPPSPYVSLS